VNQKENISK